MNSSRTKASSEKKHYSHGFTSEQRNMVVVYRMVGFQLNIALLRHKWMDYIPRGTLATRVVH